MLDFEIAEGGQAARAPVDHVAPAIDQLLVVEPQEGFQHGAVERRLQRKALARPVAGSAQADHLVLDGAAAVGFPLPDAPLKLFPPDLLAVEALLGQLALHHHLGGDAGVVHPRQPQYAVALHAPPAHQDVNLGMLEHVAHVERAGDVGRRDGEREAGLVGRALLGGHFGRVELALHPLLRPARLNRARLIRLGDVSLCHG